MANTYTKLLDDVTLEAAGSSYDQPTLHDLGADTGEYLLELVVTNDGSLGHNTKKVTVHFVTSNVELELEPADPEEDPDNLLDYFNCYHHRFDLELEPGLGAVTVRSSVPFVPSGPHLYVWLEHNPSASDVTASLYVTEIASGGDAPA